MSGRDIDEVLRTAGYEDLKKLIDYNDRVQSILVWSKHDSVISTEVNDYITAKHKQGLPKQEVTKALLEHVRRNFDLRCLKKLSEALESDSVNRQNTRAGELLKEAIESLEDKARSSPTETTSSVSHPPSTSAGDTSPSQHPQSLEFYRPEDDDPEDEFISVEDLLPYLVKLSGKVLSIGVALGVKDFTIAELDKGGDRQEACLRVFGHYFDQKRMTRKKLCEVLRLVNMGALANKIAGMKMKAPCQVAEADCSTTEKPNYTEWAGPTKSDRVQHRSHSKLGILLITLIAVGICVVGVIVLLSFCHVRLKCKYRRAAPRSKRVHSYPFVHSKDKLPKDFTIVDPSFAPLYRYWHGRVSDHFYTANIKEIGECQKNKVGNHDYKAEGIAAIIHTQQVNGTVPLYRHYSGQMKDHFYTTDRYENPSGYKYEGISGYCYGNHTDGTFPLHRYYQESRMDHFYTLNMDEIGTLEIGQIGKYGYKYEGVQCYVYRSGV